jgi:DNA polymerase-3 subunit gamma/tau
MSYLVLARKYRPKTFDEVVGQETVTRTLKNAIATGRIGHAFLLSGARGVGKTTTARILAKALNCAAADGPTPDPCGTCASCEEVTRGASLDVQEIDGASNNSVDDVRELREAARFNPARDRFKIWIIDEVHMLSTAAFNALLKTLEEPPPRVKFIFATTEYHKIPDTILSRCQQYDFRLIPARELRAHLREIADKETIHIGDESLAGIARAAAGSVRDALSLFDQVLSFSGSEVKDEDVTALLGLIDRELLLSAARGIQEGDAAALFGVVERLADYGADYRRFAVELILFFRELLLLRTVSGDSALLAQVLPEERERLKPLVAELSEEDLLRSMDLLTRLDWELKQSTDPRVTLELALLKLAQLRRLRPLAEIATRLEGLAAGAPVASPVRRLPEPRPQAMARPAPEPPPAPSPRPLPPAAPVVAAVSAPRSAAPAEEPGPVLAGPMDGDTLLEAMKSLSRPTLAPVLRLARGRLDGDTLVLVVPADFAAMARSHDDDFREMARKVAGKAFKVRVEVGEAMAAEEGEPSPGAPAEAAQKKQLLEQAAQQPIVREAVDLFGGTIVDVRESRRR